MRILRAHDHRRMPWKNGGGETVEIAVHPEGSDTSSFGWRISMATVAGDGPFSVFPEIDRTLSVLSGDGMELTIAGLGTRVLTPVDDPLVFPADAPTTARLTGGPITDLNVMTHRNHFWHRVAKRTVHSETILGTDGQWLVLFCRQGWLDISAGPAAARLGPLDTMVLTSDVLPSEPEIRLSTPDSADLFIIEIGAL